MGRNKKVFYGILFIATLVFISCKKQSDNDSSNTTTEETITDAEDNNSSDFEESDDYTWDTSSEVQITLDGSSISVDGDGATVSGSVVTISSVGNYNISGTLDDGQVIVDTDEDGIVRLILNGVDITCSNSAAINVENADKTIVILSDDTDNTLTDGSTYEFDSADEDEPNATLFSKDDLSIYGGGTLTVDANYNDGIASKDGLIVKSGTITVNSVDDGIRGKDFLIVKGGTISVTVEGDGFKSDNDDDTSCGYVSIEAGEINIVSEGDAIQAETDVLISDGTITVTSGGGSSHTVSGDDSAKGIKSGVQFIIEGGTLDISSADDALHSNESMTINDGTITLASGDDGIHTDSSIDINGGDITITKSVEGIESSIININDGSISIVASDDGINATNGTGGESDDGSELNIYGGSILITATADGLDSNGSMDMTDGLVVIYGPSSQQENGVDINGDINVSGGQLIVSLPTSSSSTETPGTSTSIYSVLVYLGSTQSSSTLFHIEDEDGNEIVTFESAKSYYSILYSSPEFTYGSTYYIYSGGEYTGGEEENGIYSGGTYSEGTEYSSFTISDLVTEVGSSSNNNQNNPGGGGNNRGGGGR